MKKTYQYRFLAVVFAVLALASCNYEEINTNPFEMTDDEGIMDGIAMGGLVTAMEKSVFPTGTQADDTAPVNAYQIAYNLSADAWSGFIGINNTFQGGNCHLNYVIVDSWVAATFSNSYTNLLDPWKKLTASAKENDTPEIAALAQILKISGWHKVLESFGPIPYTAAGKETINVPFDSEETVYTAMLKDLAEAVDELTPKAVSGVKVMADYDLVYEGDATKWVKYANSLMLRLAMRLRSVKPELAKEYALLAVNHSIGVMTEAGDAAVTPEAVGHVQTGVQVAGRQGREGAAVKGQLYRRPALCPPGVQIGGRTGQYLVQRTGLLACLVMLGTKNTAAGTAEKRDENAEDRDCPCRNLP